MKKLVKLSNKKKNMIIGKIFKGNGDKILDNYNKIKKLIKKYWNISLLMKFINYLQQFY